MLRPCLLLLTACAATTMGQATTHDPEADHLGPPIVFRTPGGWYAAPVHASLLPDGRVLCIGHSRADLHPAPNYPRLRHVWTFAPPAIGAPPPQEIAVPDLPVPLDIPLFVQGSVSIWDDLYCSGHVLDAGGEVFVAGGTRIYRDSAASSEWITGLDYAMDFDGQSWSRVPGSMLGNGPSGLPRRWYPTCTLLGDGRILVTAGFDVVAPWWLFNLTVEIHDRTTGGWSLLSGPAETPPPILNACYTHAFQLPTPLGDFNVLMIGMFGVPVLLSTDGPQRWQVRWNGRPGTLPGELPNVCQTSSLLPIRIRDGEWGYANGSLFMAGGEEGTSHLHHADVYDPVADAWHPRRDLQIGRHNGASVLLPDGRVLVLCGMTHQGGAATGTAQYVAPARSFEVRDGLSFMPELRAYHAVTLLLPDGRVLVGGGRDGDWTEDGYEKADFRILEPAYIARHRPRLSWAPAAIGYGNPFGVIGGPAREAALLSLGSMTHSIDMSQRWIELPVLSVAGGIVVLGGPDSPSVAPPGFYMLVLLGPDRVPSESKIVRVL